MRTYPAPECSDFAGWDSICDSFIQAHRDTQRPAVLISNFGEMLPVSMRERLCANGVTPLGGLPEGMVAIHRAGWYGERRRHLLEAGDLEERILREALPAPDRAQLLDEWESKQMLEQCGLRVPTGGKVTGAEAGKAAEAIGFPVVLKLVSAQLAHKTEAGAVKLDLESREEVELAVKEIRENTRSLCAGEDSFLVERMVSGAVSELIVGIKRFLLP